MSKKFWVYILTAIFFLSATVLGVTSVYRVDTVTLSAEVVSEEARQEAEELQQRLLEAYERNSMFSVEDKEAKEIIAQFPYFRFLSFEKSYPNRIIIKAMEDAEVFAVPMSTSSTSSPENYYILNIDGVVLGTRTSYENRLDGENNILVKGLTATGEKGKVLSGDAYIPALVTFCQKATEILGGLRRNVLSIEVVCMTSSSEETVFCFYMREGVKIYVGYPMVKTEEKAQIAIEKYLSLSAEKKAGGRIAVSDNHGELVLSYAEKDNLA